MGTARRERALEAESWSTLGAKLLNPEYLAAGLEVAQTQHDQANHLRQERLAAIDREIARQRRQLDTQVEQMAAVGSGEVLAAMVRRAKEIEPLIERLLKDRAELAAVPSEGLSAGDALEIEAFAEQMRAGLEHATTADLRRLYELLQVRGSVYLDPEGVRLGRKYIYRIEWQASLPLLDQSSRFKNPVIQWMPPPALISSLMSTVRHVTPAASYFSCKFSPRVGMRTTPGSKATKFIGSRVCASSPSTTSMSRKPRRASV